MCELNIIRERRGSFLRLGRRFGAIHSKQKSKPCGRHGMTGALMDRIKAHRSAPDVYDPPTLDQMADRIEELEAKLAVAGKALNRLLRPPNGHPYIEAATKEEWAVRAMNAEANLTKIIEALEQVLIESDYLIAGKPSSIAVDMFNLAALAARDTLKEVE